MTKSNVIVLCFAIILCILLYVFNTNRKTENKQDFLDLEMNNSKVVIDQTTEQPVPLTKKP
jgi:hypothetical protein